MHYQMKPKLGILIFPVVKYFSCILELYYSLKKSLKYSQLYPNFVLWGLVETAGYVLFQELTNNCNLALNCQLSRGTNSNQA